MAKLHEALVQRLGEKMDTLTAAEARVIRAAFDYRLKAKGMDPDKAAESALIEKGFLPRPDQCLRKSEIQFQSDIQPESERAELVRWARILVCACVVAVSTGWLTADAAESLGGGAAGWVRAILVEMVAFLCLVNPVEKLKTRIIVRFVGFCAVMMTFGVIHSGIIERKKETLRDIVSADYTVDSLRQKHERLRESIQSLPASYVSKREALEREYDAVLERLQSAEKKAVGDVTLVQTRSAVDLVFRVWMIVVSVVFGHAAVHYVSKRKHT
ncbi:MAG: hypothetical protein ACK5UJ_01400 [Pseudobdellovibrionaceae bacterium]|jgi:hypothetical protein